MKINEVIQEAVWDRIKGAASTATAPLRPVARVAKGLAKDLYGPKNWERDFGEPQELGVGGTVGRVAQAAKSAFAKPVAAAKPTAADIAAAGGEAPVTGGSVSEPLTPGVTVTKSSPLTLRYQKHDFLLNKQDVWIMLGPQPKVASPEMQDFLNSEAAKL